MKWYNQTIQKRREINRMADKSNTQKGNSNASASKSNANKRYGPCTESAVHTPVPGKGGRGGSGK